MEKMVAMMLLAYSIALLIGEEIRDRVYKGRKWKVWNGSGRCPNSCLNISNSSQVSSLAQGVIITQGI